MTNLVAVTTVSTFDRRGFERAAINLSYLRAIEGAGLVPLLLAPDTSAGALEAAMSEVSGLVLTGGGDVDPARYGAEAHESIIGASGARDSLEIDSIRLAGERNLPVLAICRGLQLLNVALGGSLVQDIPSMVEGACAHSIEDPRQGPAHDVEVMPGTRLASILGPGVIPVNSRHHQAAARLGDGLEVSARSVDGVIEGLELPGQRFVVAVQWHPEDMLGHFESAEKLFGAFADAARKPSPARFS